VCFAINKPRLFYRKIQITFNFVKDFVGVETVAIKINSIYELTKVFVNRILIQFILARQPNRVFKSFQFGYNKKNKGFGPGAFLIYRGSIYINLRGSNRKIIRYTFYYFRKKFLQ